MIATGCHGPGINLGTLVDYVEAMTLIGYDGKEVVEKTYTAADGELFSACRVNLGCFGVIYSITFKLPKLSNLIMTDVVVPLDTATSPEYLKKIHEENDYVEMFWWPFNNEVWVKSWKATERPSQNTNFANAWADVTQNISSDIGVYTLDLLQKAPSCTPNFCRTIWTLAKGAVINAHHGEIVLPMPDALHYQKYIDTVRCVDTEYCIKVDPDYKNVSDAWKVAVSKVKEYADKGLYPINIVVELRVHASSTAMLSPSFSTNQADKHCYIEFLGYYKSPSWDSISHDISMEWINNPNFNCRPHWAKMFQTVDLPVLVPHLKKSYGENWNKWADIRNQVDPAKMFINPYLEDMFYGLY